MWPIFYKESWLKLKLLWFCILHSCEKLTSDFIKVTCDDQWKWVNQVAECLCDWWATRAWISKSCFFILEGVVFKIKSTRTKSAIISDFLTRTVIGQLPLAPMYYGNSNSRQGHGIGEYYYYVTASIPHPQSDQDGHWVILF